VQRTDTALALRRFVEHRTAPLVHLAAGEDGAADGTAGAVHGESPDTHAP